MGLFSFIFGDSSKESAEKALGLTIAKDYLDFIGDSKIRRYGSELFLGIEGSKELSVVKATLNERKNSPSFPSNMYVISPLGIDGILILQDSNGIIYEYIPFSSPRKIYNNLHGYLNSIK